MNMDDKDTSRARETADDIAHSGTVDKAKGRTREVIGKVKEKVGNAVGSHKMEQEGRLDRAEGKKDRFKGEIKEKIEDAKQTVKAGVEVVKERFDEARNRK